MIAVRKAWDSAATYPITFGYFVSVTVVVLVAEGYVRVDVGVLILAVITIGVIFVSAKRELVACQKKLDLAVAQLEYINAKAEEELHTVLQHTDEIRQALHIPIEGAP